MDFMVPQHGEFLDDVVRMCDEEFSHTLSPDARDYPNYWRYAVKYFTTLGIPPGQDEVDDETWLSLCYPQCALNLTEGDDLLGFVLYNQFRYSSDEMTSLEVRASSELRRDGRVSARTFRRHLAITEKNIPGFREMSPRPELALTLPPGEKSVGIITPDDGYISFLVVGEDHRGKGYGTLLVDECCNRLAGRGVERVFSHASNPASVRAHEKAGFEQLLYIEPFYSDLSGTTLMGRDLARSEDDE